MERIVLDTNCLVSSLSRSSETYEVWLGLHEGRYILCVSNEILMEYQEIIARKTTAVIAENVIQYLINSDYVEMIIPYYHLQMITTDPDDNKFVDCAVAARARYIVSNDRHFNILKPSDFPFIEVLSIGDFLKLIQK
ncbi:MAG: putative toxin-antitoxin system toxin component, PIN family [Bacteroidales bacterium]|nr:putative toxin-antitoxin system toxin component, PIN family [Bacteroidales bacterium]MBR0077179.1 putative toxin-antitoxin system toxin component, PIN family [Bacteroidales bacterium]